jgi:ankyrin repeat protein
MGIKMSSVCVIKTTTLRFVIRKPFQESPATLTLRQLHLAAYFGRVNIVEHLLNKGAIIDDGKKLRNDTPLHNAALQGNLPIMKKLINRGADINACAPSVGGSVVNAAIYSGSREAIKLLIDKGASLVTVDSYNAGPLFLAAHFSDLSMFEYLIDACAGKLPPEEYDKALVAAADAGRVEVFSKLLSYSHPQECFQEALEVATKEDNWDIIMMLLERYQGRTLDCNNLFEEASSTTENQDKVLQVSSLSPIFKYLRLPWDFLCMEEYAKLRFVGCVGARQR